MNPHEALVEELAPRYPQLVREALAHFAPHRPWWSAELTTEDALMRYADIREDIIGWLVDLSPYMGWRTVEDMLNGIEDLATSQTLDDRIPVELLVDERGDTLKELVQAAGPREAQRHIRKMEIAALKRELALGILTPAPIDAVPQFPTVPGEELPPLPA